MAMEMRGSLNLSAYYKRPDQPKFYGRALINGKTYDIKGWEKDGPKGKWISLLFEDLETKNAEEFEQMAKPKPKEDYRTREYPNREDAPEWLNNDEPF
jgi:hypothetical protein